MDTFGDSAEWGGWSGYFEAKKRKLLVQFDEERARKQAETAACTDEPQTTAGTDDVFDQNTTNIFSGVAIFINGFTDPPALELRRIMMQNGGLYHAYIRKGVTTHIVATNLPFAKQVQLKGERIVRPQWITDSVARKRLLDWRRYELYPGAAGQQPSKRMKPDTAGQCTARELPTATNQHPHDHRRQGPVFSRNHPSHATTAGSAADLPPEDARNPEFVRNFYQKSRLHHLSTWKSEFQQLVGDIQAQLAPSFPGLERLRSLASEYPSTSNTAARDPASTVVMHIDMDCFFVSVGLLQKSQLRGKPVCVCHARTGRGRREDDLPPEQNTNLDEFSSMSEVASCSYEARAKGVKNGMMFGHARQLCPGLQALPYNFDEYNRISRILYYTVAEYTHAIEAISCDELYVDCTQMLKTAQATPEQFASFLRREIFERTGCPASAGLGPNKLLARLATKRAKPNGQFYLDRDADEHQVLDYIAKLSVNDLPGVGRAMEQKFDEINVNSVGDLRRTPVGVLQSKFGTFLGRKLHEMSRGIDTKPVENVTVRKSISLEINYGIRLNTLDEFERFFLGFCTELERRMRAAHVQGIHITLKLLVRRPGEPLAPDKFMGHGRCNAFNKSEQVRKPIDSKADLYKIGMMLFKSMANSIEISDLRGVGLHVGKLIHLKLPTTKNNDAVGGENAGEGIMKYLKPQRKHELHTKVSGEKSDVIRGNVPDRENDNGSDFELEDDGNDAVFHDSFPKNMKNMPVVSTGSTVSALSCLEKADIFGFNPLDRPTANGETNLRMHAMHQLFLSTSPEQLYAIYGREKIDQIRRHLQNKYGLLNNSLTPSTNDGTDNVLSPPKFADDVQQRAYNDFLAVTRKKIDANLSDCPAYDISNINRVTAFKLNYHTDEGRPPSFFAVRDADTIDNNRLDAAKPGVKARDRLMAASWYYSCAALSDHQRQIAQIYNVANSTSANVVADISHTVSANLRPPSKFKRVNSSQHLRDLGAIAVQNAAHSRKPPLPSRRKNQPTISQAFSRATVPPATSASGKADAARIAATTAVLPTLVKTERRPSSEFHLFVEDLLADPVSSQSGRVRMTHLMSNDGETEPLDVAGKLTSVAATSSGTSDVKRGVIRPSNTSKMFGELSLARKINAAPVSTKYEVRRFTHSMTTTGSARAKTHQVGFNSKRVAARAGPTSSGVVLNDTLRVISEADED